MGSEEKRRKKIKGEQESRRKEGREGTWRVAEERRNILEDVRE